MTGRVKHEKDVKESSGAQTVDQDSGIVRNVWECIPIFRVGGGGGYLWRFGMGFLCGRSRRCGAVQRVVEFLLARQSLACECEDVPTVVSSEIDCYVEVEREWSGRHNSRADARTVLDHGRRGNEEKGWFCSFNIYVQLNL